MANTVIKLSRSSTTKATRIESITSLNNYNFHKGEMVMSTYYTSSPTNINVIFAVGIDDGIGKYKIVSLIQNKLVKGVLYNRPSNTKDYLWTDGNNWYLGNEPLSSYPPGTIINDLSSQTLYIVSENDFTPRQINDTYSKEELLKLMKTVVSDFAQSDWAEEDESSPLYIYNKPNSLSGFIEDIKYRINQIPEDGFSVYVLEKIVGTSDPIPVGDSIIVPFNGYLESGSAGIVTEEDKQPGGKFFDEGEYVVGSKYLELIIRINTRQIATVYVLMNTPIEYLTAGSLIDIENNQVSLRILERNGLHFKEDGTLTVDPATETSLGYMSAEMKRKLDSLREEDYASIFDIINGNIEPRISKQSLDLEPPPSDYRIDEIPGFHKRPSGGDNSIETGMADILQIWGGTAYDSSDTLKCYYPTLTLIGNNSWNPIQVIQNTMINRNGTFSNSNNYAVAYLPCFSTVYSIVGSPSVVGFSTRLENNSVTVLKSVETSHYIPPQEGYLFVSTRTENLNGLCVRLSGDGVMDNVYEEYTETTINLCDWRNIPEFITPSLLYLKKDGVEVYDSLYNIEGKLSCTKRWGIKEFRISSWGHIQSEIDYVDGLPVTKFYYMFAFQPNEEQEKVKPGTKFIIVEEKTSDNQWKRSPEDIRAGEDFSGFKYYVPYSTTSPKEVRINYELEQPFIINTNISSSYPVYKYGTEIFSINPEDPVPAFISIRYKPKLLDNLIRISSELLKKICFNSIDDQVSDSSKNLVQNKVVKNYVDRLVSSYFTGDVGDLSKETPFGEVRTMNTANCYILTKDTISDNGEFRFPLVYGNAIKNEMENTKAYFSVNMVNHLGNIITSPYIEENLGFTINSCGILWKDSTCSVSNPRIITCNGHKYVSFSATTGEGNAVIYIKDENNNIIWTWHIWEINPETINIPITRILTPVSIWNSIPANGPTGGTEYKMMPVYLGFTGDGTQGIYYQWGRKDPFSIHSFTPTINYTKTSTSNSIQTPQTLYLTGESWNTSNISNFWDYNGPTPNTFGDYNTGKTIYDPCPVGWKVPNSNVFRGFTKIGGLSNFSSLWNIKGDYRPGTTPGISGFDFKHTFEDTQPSLSYPLFQSIGYLNGNTIQSNNTAGYYWSSVQGCSLMFTSHSVNPMSTIKNLSVGYPIHPIIE